MGSQFRIVPDERKRLPPRRNQQVGIPQDVGEAQAMLVESLRLSSLGEHGSAQRLREKVLSSAQEVPGTIEHVTRTGGEEPGFSLIGCRFGDKDP